MQKLLKSPFNLVLVGLLVWALASAVTSRTPGSAAIRNDPIGNAETACQHQFGWSKSQMMGDAVRHFADPDTPFERCVNQHLARR